jgi:hypothetical protein
MDPRYAANRLDPATLQCAGAARFRANLGLTERMPAQLLAAAPDAELVFASHEELLMHHLQVGPLEAVEILQQTPPAVPGAGPQRPAPPSPAARARRGRTGQR